MKTTASQQALNTTNKERDRKRILNQCRARKSSGVSIHFIEIIMGIPKATASARLSELQETGEVYGMRRKGDKYTSYFFEPDRTARGRHAEKYNRRNDRNAIKRVIKRFGNRMTDNMIQELQNLTQ